MKYTRKLSKSEKERNFIYIDKNYREMFPPANLPFTLTFNNHNFSVTMDGMFRIWSGRFVSKMSLRNATHIEIEKNDQTDSFLLKII